MSVHPSSVDLEAFACGEPVPSVEAHLAGCAPCAAFVERLRGALAAGPSRTKASAMISTITARRADAGGPRDDEARPASKADVPSGPGVARWLRRHGGAAVVPLAAAAAVLFYLRGPSTKDAPLPEPAPTTEGPVAPPDDPPPGSQGPETTFKGALPVAVIRERDGEQERFTGAVAVRPNDRLRVEVALDREQAILAAVLGEDGSWLEVMPEGTRPAGTHFSERSAKVDASPLRGTILVGAPDAVQTARATRRFDGLATIRVEWEPTAGGAPR